MTMYTSAPQTADCTPVSRGQALIDMGREKLVKRFAASMARLDENYTSFRSGLEEDASDEDRELRQDYLEEARDLLIASGIFENMALVEVYLRKIGKPEDKALCIDAVEAFIAQRIAVSEAVQKQISAYRSGFDTTRDAEWCARASRSLNKALNDVAFGHKLRLKALRDGDFAVLVSGRDKMIENLTQQNRREKALRIQACDRIQAQMDSLMEVIAAQGPELLAKAYAARDAAVAAFDAKVAAQDAQAEVQL